MTLQKSARDFVKHSAQKMGIAVDFYPPPGSFRRQLRDLLAQMKINVVLDVGAYIGNYAAELRATEYKGKIISFEPVPASYEQLQARMRHDPLWSGQPFGLSDENREAVMNTFSRGDFNSLLTLRKDSEAAYSLESASRSGAGSTNLFLYPGCRFHRVGAMLTNFHLPRTSLLLLVCAFAGTELTLAAYRHAVAQRYRFFSYGDCMLIL